MIFAFPHSFFLRTVAQSYCRVFSCFALFEGCRLEPNLLVVV